MEKTSLIEAFRLQSTFCEEMESPFTSWLLKEAARDWEEGGAMAALLPDWQGDPVQDALALRFAGALHYAVLTKRSHELSALYPPSAQRIAWEDIAHFIKKERAFLLSFIERGPPQTNETGRSAGILAGLLEIAERTDYPLELCEIGTSAGLNLFPDRFFYQTKDWQWGSEKSGVHLSPQWEGRRPPLSALLRIDSRKGVDQHPIRVEREEERLLLQSYVWADQSERKARLQAALAIAQREKPSLMQADAADWLEEQIKERAPNRTKVIYHSVVWQYLTQVAQARIIRLMEEAGAKADTQAPLAWLALEPDLANARSFFRITLRLWPGGQKETLGDMEPHGRALRWKGAWRA